MLKFMYLCIKQNKSNVINSAALNSSYRSQQYNRKNCMMLLQIFKIILTSFIKKIFLIFLSHVVDCMTQYSPFNFSF